MLAVAAFSALIAIEVGCTLVEGIVLSAILGLVLWVALSLPLPVWVRQLVLSGLIGSISGLIAAGVYSDFFASRTVEYAAAPPRPAGRKADDRTASPTAADAATSAPPSEPTPQVPKDGPASAQPPTKFAEYSTVRVARFVKAERFFVEGADEITRQPRIGDEGIVVATGSHEGERLYMIECITVDGDTVWVAEFSPDELEFIADVGEVDGI